MSISENLRENKRVVPAYLQRSYDQSWHRMFTELKDHMTKYGICSINDHDLSVSGIIQQPLCSTFRLRNWLRFQRKEYKLFLKSRGSVLTEEKVKLLESCGLLETNIPTMKVVSRPFHKKGKDERTFLHFKKRATKKNSNVGAKPLGQRESMHISESEEKGSICWGKTALSQATPVGGAVPKHEKSEQDLFLDANALILQSAQVTSDFMKVGSDECPGIERVAVESKCGTNQQTEHTFDNGSDEDDSSDHDDDDDDDVSFTLPEKFTSRNTEKNNNKEYRVRRSVRSKNHHEESNMNISNKHDIAEIEKDQFSKNTKRIQQSKAHTLPGTTGKVKHSCKLEKNWLSKFNQLMEFKDKNGHCNLPHSYSGDFQLRDWVGSQRQQYKKMKRGLPSHMSTQRIAMLEAEGFIFEKGPNVGDVSEKE
eukprot:CAMPEP_0116021660 /NCGR_PEP_ID=MMETSP0321-20121206/10526_1 /TAXON_ID=163516 /ORGANISM="Leptocylindrus danicus var. danicus, Strain B650" /LENGTH=422 /DNA_ID=CAMNT_0003492587 /DNA_START=197 /DNA_END=1465 /DNA_ORIENTATION=-